MSARFIPMRVALQNFLGKGDLRLQTVEDILNLVLETAKGSWDQPWEDIDMDAALVTASEIFKFGDHLIQAKTLDFMKKLIHVFFYDLSTSPNELKSEHARELIEFYSTVVLRYAIKPALLTEACHYAERHTRQNDPNRQNALEAFEMSMFADYAIEKFEKKAVKKLLIIAKEKIFCHSERDPLMPALLNFIEKVCESQESCGVMIRVCHVLGDLFKNIAFRQAMHEFDMLKGSPVFRFIMNHTDPRMGKKCWVALAELFGTTFLCADYETKEQLIEGGLFPRIKEMMSENEENLNIILVEAVRYAAKDRRFIFGLLFKGVYLPIIELYGRRSAPSEVRRRAGEAITELLSIAPYHEVYLAAESGFVTAFSKLLSSSDEPIVISTLGWIDIMLNRCTTTELRKKLASTLKTSDTMVILNRLYNHSNSSVVRLASSVSYNVFAAERDISWDPNVSGAQFPLGLSHVGSDVASSNSHIDSSSRSTSTVSNPGPSYINRSWRPSDTNRSSGSSSNESWTSAQQSLQGFPENQH